MPSLISAGLPASGPGRLMALAWNGTIVATTRSFTYQGKVRFGFMVRPAVMRRGTTDQRPGGRGGRVSAPGSRGLNPPLRGRVRLAWRRRTSRSGPGLHNPAVERRARLLRFDGCATRSRALLRRSRPRSLLFHQPRPAVFALTNPARNGPGALFARYSRYGDPAKALSDEFTADAAAADPEGRLRPFDGEEGQRAAKLYESDLRWFSVTIRSPSSVVPTSPANGCVEHPDQRCCSAVGWLPTSSSPPATSPTTGDARWRLPLYLSGDALDGQFEAAMNDIFLIYSGFAHPGGSRAAERWPRGDDEPRPGAVRSRPRHWTCCGAFCRLRLSVMSGSTPPAGTPGSCCSG